MKDAKIWFEVDAGKFDGGLKNCKYCNSFTDSGDAQVAYDNVADYPWAIMQACVLKNGSTVRYDLVRNYPEWRDVWHEFHSDNLSWTQAFEALMSECGMPMEQALECLANHFDRRPAITVQEVR